MYKPFEKKIHISISNLQDLYFYPKLQNLHGEDQLILTILKKLKDWIMIEKHLVCL